MADFRITLNGDVEEIANLALDGLIAWRLVMVRLFVLQVGKLIFGKPR